MAPTKVINCSSKKGAFTGKNNGSNEIVKKGNAKDHGQDEQTVGTKGKGKGKDIESKTSQKKDPKCRADIQ